MTVVTLMPVAMVFAFLQRFITTGIASNGDEMTRSQKPLILSSTRFPSTEEMVLTADVSVRVLGGRRRGWSSAFRIARAG